MYDDTCFIFNRKMKSFVLAVVLMVAVQANANPLQTQQSQNAKTLEAIDREIQDVGMNAFLGMMQAFSGLDVNAFMAYQKRLEVSLYKAWTEDIVNEAFGKVDWTPILKSTLDLVRSAKTPISQINWNGFKSAIERLAVAECKNNPFLPETQNQNMVRMIST